MTCWAAGTAPSIMLPTTAAFFACVLAAVFTRAGMASGASSSSSSNGTAASVHVCPRTQETFLQVEDLCIEAGFKCTAEDWTDYLANPNYVAELEQASVNQVIGLNFDHVQQPLFMTVVLLLISLLRLCTLWVSQRGCCCGTSPSAFLALVASLHDLCAC